MFSMYIITDQVTLLHEMATIEQQPLTHYQKYCDTIKAGSKRWYAAHKDDEHVKEVRRQIAEKHKDANRELDKRIKRDRYKNDPEFRERKREYMRNYMRLKRELETASITFEVC